MWASFWGHLQVVERILAARAHSDLQNNVRITSECTQVQRHLKGQYVRYICLWHLSDNGIMNLYVEWKNKANEWLLYVHVIILEVPSEALTLCSFFLEQDRYCSVVLYFQLHNSEIPAHTHAELDSGSRLKELSHPDRRYFIV